jgi:23S rRNA (adenine2030-N6)-methyltransferase
LAAVRAFHADMRSAGIRNIVAVELDLKDSTNPDRLNGCGLLVINPPYGFERQAGSIAQAILEELGHNATGTGWAVIGLTDE